MNDFAYFSEIEEHFSRRRGSILLLNTLDWALIETWREAGVPLQAVLRGIDSAFEKFEARAHKAGGRLRKINGLAWCAQAVLQAAEELVEASTGLAPARPPQDAGFEAERVAAYLDRNAEALQSCQTDFPQPASEMWAATALHTAARLRELAATVRSGHPLPLDELDRTLTVLEEKLLLALQAAATEAELVGLRAEAERALAPYRARIGAVQLRQIHAQFLHKRLLELRGLPRLSLFYMGHED
jgi:hypothetical protein